jgi:HEAT repeat protein
MPDRSEPSDEFYIGPVGPIPIREPDATEDARNRADAAVADALRTPEELQGGMYHERAGVRWRVVDRLVARGFDHPATIPTLVDVLANDPDSHPRFSVAMVLYRFDDDDRVIEALLHAMRNDPDADVRGEAMYSLDQLGMLDG